MMGTVVVTNPSKWRTMKAYHLNDHYRCTTILTDEDLLDFEDGTRTIDSFFGANLTFHLEDGGAIVQHNRPWVNALIGSWDDLRDAEDAYALAAAEYAQNRQVVDVAQHYAEGTA
ncbi:MAG: hypothetical protein DI554_00350 [Sphingobium sp.]|nr:MAG: hypothetical protein DI554_00350 [Sphingobium sp.]